MARPPMLARAAICAEVSGCARATVDPCVDGTFSRTDTVNAGMRGAVRFSAMVTSWSGTLSNATVAMNTGAFLL